MHSVPCLQYYTSYSLQIRMHSFNLPSVICEHGTVNVKWFLALPAQFLQQLECAMWGSSKMELCKSIPEHNRFPHFRIHCTVSSELLWIRACSKYGCVANFIGYWPTKLSTQKLYTLKELSVRGKNFQKVMLRNNRKEIKNCISTWIWVQWRFDSSRTRHTHPTAHVFNCGAAGRCQVKIGTPKMGIPDAHFHANIGTPMPIFTWICASQCQYLGWIWASHYENRHHIVIPCRFTVNMGILLWVVRIHLDAHKHLYYMQIAYRYSC